MLRILLIDDLGDSLAGLRLALEEAGYQVIASLHDPFDLAAHVQQLQADVVLVSTQSPSRDVLEQLAIANQSNPRPIVMFSSDGESHTVRAAIQAGVTAYVVDGLQPHRTIPILETALARFEQEQGLRQELHAVQTRLSERKLVERAKGILMARKGWTEQEAYTHLRKLAMDRKLKLAEVSHQLIAAATLL